MKREAFIPGQLILGHEHGCHDITCRPTIQNVNAPKKKKKERKKESWGKKEKKNIIKHPICVSFAFIVSTSKKKNKFWQVDYQFVTMIT